MCQTLGPEPANRLTAGNAYGHAVPAALLVLLSANSRAAPVLAYTTAKLSAAVRAILFWSAFLLTLVLGGPGARAQKTTAKHTAPPVPVPAFVRADSLVLRARALLARYQEADALDACKQAIQLNPTHYEALWRASELSSRVGVRFTDENRQEHYFQDARAYAARALDVHTSFAPANYAMALAITRLGALGTLRQRLSSRLESRPFLEAALAADPHYADAWQLMGHWQFKVANYSIFERFASRLLVGSVPRGATNARAVAALRRAIEYQPQRVELYYDLGRMYYLRGQHEKAAQVLADAQMLQPATNEELAVVRQCEALLDRIQRRP